MREQNSISMATHILFYFLHAFLVLKDRENDEKSQQSIAANRHLTILLLGAEIVRDN